MSLNTHPGLLFNGINDVVTIPNSLTMIGSITLEALVYPIVLGGTNNYHMIIGLPNQTDSYLGIGDGTARPIISLHINGVQSFIYGSNPIQPNTWTHILGTYDGTRMTMYVNGVPSGQTLVTGSVNISGTNALLGAQSSGGNKFVGILSQVRIYNRALYDFEARNNYNGLVTRTGLVGEWLFPEGTGTTTADTSGSGNTGTLTGCTWANPTQQRGPISVPQITTPNVQNPYSDNLCPDFTSGLWTLAGTASISSNGELSLNSANDSASIVLPLGGGGFTNFSWSEDVYCTANGVGGSFPTILKNIAYGDSAAAVAGGSGNVPNTTGFKSNGDNHSMTTVSLNTWANNRQSTFAYNLAPLIKYVYVSYRWDATYIQGMFKVKNPKFVAYTGGTPNNQWTPYVGTITKFNNKPAQRVQTALR